MASAYYYNPGAGNLPNANMPAMHNVNQMQIGMQPNVYGQPQYRPQMPINEAPNMRKRMPSKVRIETSKLSLNIRSESDLGTE